MLRALGITVALAGLIVVSPSTPGAAADGDSSVDARLKIRDGLILALDAASLNRAREANGLPTIPPSGSLDIWPDSSGAKRDLRQRSADHRPKLVPLEEGRAVVRFDGKDDFLANSGLDRSTRALTLFVVAAPRANPGMFSAFFAANAAGKNDYTSGFSLDLGPQASSRLEAINLEGIGFGGARDLMNDAQPLGAFRRISARVSDTTATLSVDGREQGRRERAAGPIRLDELTLGARFYSNTPAPPAVGSVFDGDVAEVLLYDRALSDAEVKSVDLYLAAKHAGLDGYVAKQADPRTRPLQTVANPPRVQMLAPGFAVDELPIKLANLNNVRYRHDGKLVALGYNGNVYVLSDTNGDGLEDHVEVFWEGSGRIRGPIGMALTPPGYRLGSGVFVASKGKVSLVLDADGDDRAEKEIIVAEGWPELPVAVDALGVAIAPDGSLYFGLGTGDYTNAYRVDDKGLAKYRLDQERGAILRVSADFKSREIVATGIRFPVGLAFNARGDLFATDQEGATWLPNGNPFDELLHIQPKRHYGFPPRHPQHLANVVDEPSTFDYGPQHQSTCGLAFNEPCKPGGPIFGPESWRGSAIVCGYSRGKIWRTNLVPTENGYVASNQLIACLDKLTVDAAVTPDGGLVVACHSGGPDWGSGPNGEGTLYKIRLTDRDAPQPVLAWSESPREIRVAFDRPLTPEMLAGLASKVSIESGRFVSAGDRFETLRPGYAAVAAQAATPRYAVPVRGVVVTADRRTLIVATDADTTSAPHAITLPDPSRASLKGLPQRGEIDLAYNLAGAKATWTDASGSTLFSGTVPHLDLDVSRALTAGSAGHQALSGKTRGTLTLEANLDLHDVLRPAVQPGSTLDAVLPRERVTLRISGSGPFSATAGALSIQSIKGEAVSLVLGEVATPVPVKIVLQTSDAGQPKVVVSTFTADHTQPRPIPLRRVLVPWATASGSPASETAATLPAELAGGHWERGRAVFFGETAKCSKCHAVAGQGGTIGPDLANLTHRDYASVVRDVREPSFAIHPDHIAQVVAMRDGRILTGVPRSEGDTILLGDGDGHVTKIARGDIEEARPSPTSTMPTGLLDALSPEATRDLLTYLMTPGLEPAPIHREGAPPPRPAAEVEAALKAIPASDPKSWKPELRILLLAGEKDHGVDEHDYPLWRERWSKLLPMAEGVKVRVADGWPSAADLKWADVAVWYSANAGWSVEKAKDLDAFLARGGGLVYLHWAINGRDAPEALAERIGLASLKPGTSKYRHGSMALDIPTSANPITAGLKSPAFEDESYWNLFGDVSRIHVLATTREEGADRPMMWTREAGEGRVVGCVLGHYSWTFDDPIYRILALRAIAWSAHEPADRLQGLSTIGARMGTGR